MKSKKAAKKASGSGVIRTGGDKLGYLGHFRSSEVMKRGHNQGMPVAGGFNPNPISDPQGTGVNPMTPSRSTTSRMSTPMTPPTATPQRSTPMPSPSGPTPRMSTPMTPPAATGQGGRTARGTGGVSRSTVNSGVSGRSTPVAGRQAAVTPAQQALEQLRGTVGNLRTSRQSARSAIAGGGNKRSSRSGRY